MFTNHAQLVLFLVFASVILSCKANDHWTYERIESCNSSLELTYTYSGQAREILLESSAKYEELLIYGLSDFLIISCTVNASGLRYIHSNGIGFAETRPQKSSITITSSAYNGKRACFRVTQKLEVNMNSTRTATFSCGYTNDTDEKLYKLRIHAQVDIPLLRERARQELIERNQTEVVTPIELTGPYPEREWIDFTTHPREITCSASGYPLPEMTWYFVKKDLIEPRASESTELNKDTSAFRTVVYGNNVSQTLLLDHESKYPVFFNDSTHIFVVCNASNADNFSIKTFHLISESIVFPHEPEIYHKKAILNPLFYLDCVLLGVIIVIIILLLGMIIFNELHIIRLKWRVYDRIPPPRLPTKDSNGNVLLGPCC